MHAVKTEDIMLHDHRTLTYSQSDCLYFTILETYSNLSSSTNISSCFPHLFIYHKRITVLMRRKQVGLQIRKFQPLVRVTEATEVLEVVTGGMV